MRTRINCNIPTKVSPHYFKVCILFKIFLSINSIKITTIQGREFSNYCCGFSSAPDIRERARVKKVSHKKIILLVAVEHKFSSVVTMKKAGPVHLINLLQICQVIYHWNMFVFVIAAVPLPLFLLLLFHCHYFVNVTYMNIFPSSSI